AAAWATHSTHSFDQGAHRPFAERALRNISRGRADYSALMLAARITLAHFSVSSAMSLPKSAGEPASTVPPRISEPRFHVWIADASVALLVELLDDLGRRGLRCADAIPLARLVARQELTHGRNAGQHVRARGGGYRERAQPASPDIAYR